MGTNAAGLKAEKDSLIENIRLFDRPSIITIQETWRWKIMKYLRKSGQRALVGGC